MVNVSPVADCVAIRNSNSVMVEDNTGAQRTNVGEIISNNLIVTDDAVTTPAVENNNVPEYLSRVELRETITNPLGIPILDFSVSTIINSGGSSPLTGLGPHSSGNLVYDLSTNIFAITSQIIETARTDGKLGELENIDLQDADDDIRFILNELFAVPAIPQSDLDAVIAVEAKTIDVNPILEQANESLSCNRLHTVRIRANADPVDLTVEQTLFNTYKEDDDGATTLWKPNGIPLRMSVDSSIDNTDGSEYLEILITIPYDSRYGAPIGTLNHFSDSNGKISVTKIGGGGQTAEVWRAAVDTTLTAEEQETALNSYLASNLFFVPGSNWSGKLTGTDGIKVELLSIEKASGNQVVTKQTNDTGYIGIDLLPVVSIVGCQVEISSYLMARAHVVHSFFAPLLGG